RECSDRSDGRRGRSDQASDVLLQHDRAEGGWPDRQLRRDRGHPLESIAVDRAARPPAPREGRRRFFLWSALASCLVVPWLAGGPPLAVVAQERRYTVAFANLTEEPGATLEGTGFTGREVRESFSLAVRRYPIDLVFYDNHRDPQKALANAEDAVKRKIGRASCRERV